MCLWAWGTQRGPRTGRQGEASLGRTELPGDSVREWGGGGWEDPGDHGGGETGPEGGDAETP